MGFFDRLEKRRAQVRRFLNKGMMKKNDYAFFGAIRADELETVSSMLAADPALVNIPAPKKPADTWGMSPLQAALCTGWHRDIAWFLLEHGADVNFCADAKLDGYPVVRRREHRRLERPPLRMGRAGHHAHAPCVEAHPGGG